MPHVQPNPDTDRNLLFGVCAMQLRLLSSKRFAEACALWTFRKNDSLGDVLVEHGWLTPADRSRVDVLLEETLRKHGGNTAASLYEAAGDDVPRVLAVLKDPDIARSIAQLGSRAEQTTFTPTLQTRARYNLVKLQGEGGLGRVWVARDDAIGREVALKELRPDRAHESLLVNRFLSEACVTGQLEHPGIVPVYELARDPANQQPFYTMRLIKGRTLTEAIRAYHKERDQRSVHVLEFRKLLNAFVSVCGAVAYAHSRGVVHRDLKGQNVIVGDFGEVIVLDWGLAKVLGQTADLETAPITLPEHSRGGTLPGHRIGTPAYMAPEQALGRQDLIDQRTDVYELGATLYEILTGWPPFDGQNTEEVLKKVINEDPKQPRQLWTVPRALEAICLRALAKEPRDRYQTALELARDVEHWLADEPVEAYPEPWTVKTRRWVGRHRQMVTGVAAALLALLVGGGVAGVWYVNDRAERRADEARRQAELEARQDQLNRDVSTALNEADKHLQDLRTRLDDPKKVHVLLSAIQDWQALVERATQAGKQAGSLVASQKGLLNVALSQRLATLRTKLDAAREDYRLAKELDEIRLEAGTLVDGKFDVSRAGPKYAAAFAKAGIDVSQEAAAAMITRSPIRYALVAALDYWAQTCHWKSSTHAKLLPQLLRLARQADPNPWRDRLRDHGVWGNPEALQELSTDIDLAAQGPQIIETLALLLEEQGRDPVPLLRSALMHYPSDFWLHFDIANALNAREPKAAAAHCQAALAVRPQSGAAWTHLGNALLRQEEGAAAIAAYRKALALDDKNAVAWSNLGLSYRKQKDLAAAFAACKKSIAINERYANAWNDLGLILQDQGDLQGAIEVFRKALAINPRYTGAWINLGVAFEAQKNLTAASNLYRMAVLIDDKSSVGWSNLGSTLRALGDLPAAIDACKQAIALDERNAAAWNNLGSALGDRNDLQAAVEAHRKAVAIDDQSANAWSNLASALRTQKDLPGAVEACKRALAIDDKYSAAWNNLGNALADGKDLEGAAAAYRKTVAIDNNNLVAWNNLGNVLRDRQELTASIEACNKALEIDPSNAVAWNNLGLALCDQEKIPAAIDAYRKALASDPNYATAWNSLGLAFEKSKDLARAVEAFRKALAIDHRFAYAWNNLGNALAEQDDLTGAIDAYKKALEIDGRCAHAWDGLGNALRFQGRLPEAIDAHKKSLEIDDKNATAWSNFGIALQEQNKLPESIAAYKKALAIKPAFAAAWNNLGTALRDQKDPTAAIEAYRKALGIDSRNAGYWNNLGIALQDLKELPAAIDAFKKAVAIDDNYAIAWNSLGVALKAQNDRAAAIDAYRQAIARDPRYAGAWNNLGLALKSQKDLPAAIAAHLKAVALAPKDALAHCCLGLALRDDGQLAESLKALQRGHDLGSGTPGWRRPSAAWVKRGQDLLALEQSLPAVLQGEAVSAQKYADLADLCQRYLKRKADAVRLYEKAFAAAPDLADERKQFYRYNAACAAVLAAAGKDIHAAKLSDDEKASFRAQALGWLKEELAALTLRFSKNAPYAIELFDELQHWQQDRDFASVRDAKDLATLPQGDASAWQSLWAEVANLAKEARSAWTETEFTGLVISEQPAPTYAVKLDTAHTYVIDLESQEFDCYLRLQDDKGMTLVENDDVNADTLNSRVIFRPTRDGAYHIMATAFERRGGGTYRLVVRAFRNKK